MLILYGFETYSKLVKLIFIPPCLTSDDATTRYDKLAAKFDTSIPDYNTTPTLVVESAPINELPVEEPAPKKRLLLFIRKTPLQILDYCLKMWLRKFMSL